MRFLLDHDVDARIVGLLVRRGHEAWTAHQANLDTAADDSLTVYADDKRAVLVTHDKEFSQRRRKNVIGMHLQLQCEEPDAIGLVDAHLDQIVAHLGHAKGDMFITVSAAGVQTTQVWT